MEVILITALSFVLGILVGILSSGGQVRVVNPIPSLPKSFSGKKKHKIFVNDDESISAKENDIVGHGLL